MADVLVTYATRRGSTEEIDEPVAQLGQCPGGGELVTDLRHVAVPRVEPGQPGPDRWSVFRVRSRAVARVLPSCSSISIDTVHRLLSSIARSIRSSTAACARARPGYRVVRGA